RTSGSLSVSHRQPTLASFFLSGAGALPDLPALPTRRSSDLADTGHGTLPFVIASPDGGQNWRMILLPASGGGKDHPPVLAPVRRDRKSTRLNSSHLGISYAVFCLKKKNNNENTRHHAAHLDS